MAGQIKTMLETIISKRGGGDSVLIRGTRTKLILKGLHPDKFTLVSPDDPAIIEKIKLAASEMGVSL